MKTKKIRFTVLTLALCLVVVACNTTKPIPPGKAEEKRYVSTDFYSSMPVDVVILPIDDQAPNEPEEYVLTYLRRKIYEELLQKKYSALSLQMINDNWSKTAERVRINESSTRGLFDEDAILYITLTQWDTHWFRSFNKILTGANLTLVDSKSGKTLWEYKVKDLLSKTSGHITIRNYDECQKRLIRTFAKRIVESLPSKKNF